MKILYLSYIFAKDNTHGKIVSRLLISGIYVD